MELRTLRYLVALADEGQFTRAAKREYVAQPALSRQIARLESELGVQLVERTTRRVTFTTAGSLLVDHARRILASVDLALEELDDLAGLRTGQITIGAPPTMGPVDLSEVLSRFRIAHPTINLAVREELSVWLADALRKDELDLAFLSDIHPAARQGLELEVISSEEMVAIAPLDHPLAKRNAIRLAELRAEAFIGFRRGATIRAQIEDALTAIGLVPQILLETNDVTRVRSLVAAGLGVAILPYSDAVRPGPEVAPLRIEDASFRYSVHLGLRAGRRHSPAARTFVEMFKTYVAATGPGFVSAPD